MKLIEIANAQVIDNAPTLMEISGGIVDFMLRIFGIIAIIGLVISAIIYFTAGGNEDRIKLAKKSFYYSIVGISIGLGILIFIAQIKKILG